MTEKEAIKVIQIIMTVHDDCSYCAHYVLTTFTKEWPEYRKLAEKEFRDKFKGEELSDER